MTKSMTLPPTMMSEMVRLMMNRQVTFDFLQCAKNQGIEKDGNEPYGDDDKVMRVG